MIAQKILRDPSVLEIARSNLVKWRTQSPETAAQREWADLIERADTEAVLTALLRVDDEGIRLRSSSPFTGVLDEYERHLIYEGPRKRDA
jgi:hypothetical protein